MLAVIKSGFKKGLGTRIVSVRLGCVFVILCGMYVSTYVMYVCLIV